MPRFLKPKKSKITDDLYSSINKKKTTNKTKILKTKPIIKKIIKTNKQKHIKKKLDLSRCKKKTEKENKLNSFLQDF